MKQLLCVISILCAFAVASASQTRNEKLVCTAGLAKLNSDGSIKTKTVITATTCSQSYWGIKQEGADTEYVTVLTPCPGEEKAGAKIEATRSSGSTYDFFISGEGVEPKADPDAGMTYEIDECLYNGMACVTDGSYFRAFYFPDAPDGYTDMTIIDGNTGYEYNFEKAKCVKTEI